MARTGTRPGATPARPDDHLRKTKGRPCGRPLHWMSSRLTAGFALLHEAGLGGAGEFLAVGAHGLGFAGIVHAFRHERGFGRARERLAVLAHGFAFAGILCEGRSGREGGDDGSQENSLHCGVSLDQEKWADWNLESV